MPNSLSDTTLAVTQPPSGVMTPVNPSEFPDAQFADVDFTDVEKGFGDKTEVALPRREDHGWRRIVRGFTPSYVQTPLQIDTIVC